MKKLEVPSKELLWRLYVIEGKSVHAIGSELSCAGSYAWKLLKEYGIPIRRNGEQIEKNNYSGFFAEWSSEMAWVLGLMFTDGNVSIGPRNYRAILYSVDPDMIEQVSEIMRLKYKPIWRDSRIWSLAVGGKLDCDDLIALGCVPNKSRIIQFPDVPEQYVADFIRGLWDGDGCIFVRDRRRDVTYHGKPNQKTYQEMTTYYVSGSRDFVVSLEQTVRNYVGIEARVKEKRGAYNPYYIINYYHRNSLKLVEWLYRDSTPLTRLGRKYELAKPFLSGGAF